MAIVTSPETKTPRCDAIVHMSDEQAFVELQSLARELERENNELRAALDRCLRHFEKIRGDQEDTPMMWQARRALAARAR